LDVRGKCQAAVRDSRLAKALDSPKAGAVCLAGAVHRDAQARPDARERLRVLLRLAAL